MPLAAWNLYSGITYYQQTPPSLRSLEGLISVIFRLMTFINIGSTCVIYTVTARLFREELWALLHFQWLEKVIRREGHSRIFSVSRRIAPA
jgi:hypothetical protein